MNSGMASLHLVAFYWTKADVANNKERRVIQSVGTPYRGSGLAGCVAGIGNVVGIGCGSQSDLTYVSTDHHHVNTLHSPHL